jgi:FdhD protein
VEGKVKTHKATRIKDGDRQEIDELVAEEAILRVFLNDREIAALSCTPHDEAHLAVGFLFSEGLLKSRDEIKSLDRSEGGITVRTHAPLEIPEDSRLKGVLTSGCGKGKSLADWEKIDPLQDVMVNLDLTLSPEQVHQVMLEFEKRSELFRRTGGVHSAALAASDELLLFNEDIGRHNAVDKVLGESFLKGLDLKDKFLVISGRVSSDLISKLWNCSLSLVVSRTAPTTLAVRMAQRLGITVIGFARGKRMNVYSYPVRVQ